MMPLPARHFAARSAGRFAARASGRRPSGDGGATLIFALIIITVISVVISALLPQATSGVANTVALRVDTAANYDADGAAQVAINTLRENPFDNDPASTTFSSCFGATPTSGTLVLPNFYPGTNGSAPSSAAITCTAEPGTGAEGTNVPITAANRPNLAVLTLGTSSLEFGQSYAQVLNTVDIRGGIASDSNISAGLGSVAVTPGSSTGPVTGDRTGCLPLAAQFTPHCTTLGSAVADPNYAAPTTPAPPSSLPACNNNTKVADFLPGLYTTAATFNTCQASWIHLTPGVYYFNFPASPSSASTWTLGSKVVVGGTLANAETNSPPTLPGACISPLVSATAAGVELVLGGTSQLAFQNNSSEFCASYSASKVPIVVYGLKATVGSGANAVPKEGGCTTVIVLQLFPPLAACDALGTPLLTASNIYFQGMVYMPLASVDVAIADNSHATFAYGDVSRTFSMTPVDILCSTCIRASIPDISPGLGIATTFVDLTVYVCPGVATCSTSGNLALTARVSIFDPTGVPTAGARQMTVLSWSEQQH